MAASGLSVRLIHTDDLDELLDELQGGLDRPTTVIASEDLQELLRPYAERAAVEHAGTLGHFTGSGMKVFTTGEQGKLVPSFLFSFEIRALVEDGDRGDLVLSGTADFNEESMKLSDIRLTSEEIHWPKRNTSIRIGHGTYAGRQGVPPR